MANTVNGVDTESFEKTCELIKQNPNLAKTQFCLHNRWVSGGHNKAQIKEYYAVEEEQEHKVSYDFDIDEPTQLLGNDDGASPVEYLLAALSSCMTTSIIYHAAARGINIEAMESDFQGDLDLQGFLNLSKDVPIGYQKIVIIFKVKTDAPLEKLEELYRFSPVYSIVSKSVPVTVKFEKL